MEMKEADSELMDLITRALTSRDDRARRALQDAAGRDPQLKAFCSELDEVVNILSGSINWRQEKPNAELTGKVRAAVAAKLGQAPQSFRLVFVNTDLGRKDTAKKTLLTMSAIGGALLVLVLAIGLLVKRGQSGRLDLSGKLDYENALKEDGAHPATESLKDWECTNTWEIREGLHFVPASAESPAGSAYLKNNYQAGQALAFTIDIKTPELLDGTSVMAFLAEADPGLQPIFGNAQRPERGLFLEITPDGMLVQGTGHKLLSTKPTTNSAASFYKVRIEHLGSRVRVLINNEVLFDDAVEKPLQGELHPGVRVSGPKKSEVTFNAARIER